MPKHYSYANARKKIETLSELGFRFIGNLPENAKPWLYEKIFGIFLFTKENKYYQYKGEPLFLNSKFNIKFDKNNELLPKQDFSHIVNSNYIYILIIQKSLNDETENTIALLKQNTAMSGHFDLAGPYSLNCGFFLMAYLLEEMPVDFLNAQLEDLPCYPKAAYALVMGEKALFYIRKNIDGIEYQKFPLESVEIIRAIQKNSQLAEMALERGQDFLCLSKELSPTSMNLLIRATKSYQPDIFGGEVYYSNSKILLTNHKSGSFMNEVDRALPAIRAIFGSEGEKAFYSAVESEEVLLEVKKRTRSVTVLSTGASSPKTSIFQSPSLTESTQPAKALIRSPRITNLACLFKPEVKSPRSQVTDTITLDIGKNNI